MREHIRTITDFLSAHGATRIKPEQTKGGHIRINYMWRGSPKFVVVPHTPSEYRGTANTLAQLRRELGKPITHTRMPRTLDELTADLAGKAEPGLKLHVEEPVMRSVHLTTEPFNPVTIPKELTDLGAKKPVTGQCYIGMGHYDVHHPDDPRKVLRVSITEEVWVAAGSPEYVKFSRVDDGKWRISCAEKAKRSASWRQGRPGFIDTDISNPPEIYERCGIWGKTLGKAVVEEGCTILISVDMSNLKPIKKRDYNKPPAPAPNPKAYGKDEIRKALDVISHVVRTSSIPLKLVKLPDGQFDINIDLGN